MLAKGQRLHPKHTDRRGVNLEDAVDDGGIGEHVEIVVVPYAEWVRRGRALEDHAGHSGLYLAILNLQPVHNDSAFSRCMPRESSNEKLLPFTTRWSTSTILQDVVNISCSSPGFIGSTGATLSRRV